MSNFQFCPTFQLFNFVGFSQIFSIFVDVNKNSKNIFNFQLCDRMSNPGILSVLSNINLILSFIFIGPISILDNVEPTWISICICTTFMGISFGSVMVTSMGRVQKTVARMGFDQDWKTDLILCGRWTFSFLKHFFYLIFLNLKYFSIFMKAFGQRYFTLATLLVRPLLVF